MTGHILGNRPIDSNSDMLLFSYPTVPGQPSNVTAVPDSTTSIKVEWDPVDECEKNGNITKYFVQVYNRTGYEVADVNVSGNTFFVVIEDLQQYTNYSVVVYATTAAGKGLFSEYQNTTTHRPGAYKENGIFIA